MNPSFISRFSIFSYSNTTRINGREVITNSQGGILTLVLIAIILLATVMKTKEMFEKTNITSKTSSQYNFVPPMIKLSTIPNDTNNIPFMFGIDPFTYTTASSKTYYVSAEGEYVQQINSNPDDNKATSFSLQQCTAEHFWSIPNITSKATQWGISKWLCLPLNKVYEIGGSFLNKNYKSLRIVLKCNGVWCSQSKTYTLGRYVDPTGVQPSTYYLNQQIVMTTSGFTYSYLTQLSMNTLIVDDSFLPTPMQSKSTGVSPKPSSIIELLINSERTKLYIETGNEMLIYNRSYMKVLDVMSFIGGIVNVILIAGILVSGFNRYYFEMCFAQKYFYEKIKQNMSFFNYLKTMVYGALKGTRMQPKNWYQAQAQFETIATVNKMLDIINMNKRIVFLEQAITLLFEDHQLKALHLIHPKTRKEADDRIEEHKLRERLVHFIIKSKKINQDNVLNENQAQIVQNKMILPKKDIKNGNHESEVKIINSHQTIGQLAGELQLANRPVNYSEKKQKNVKYQIWDINRDIQLMDQISRMKYQQQLINLEQEAEEIGQLDEEDLRKDKLLADIDQRLNKFIIEGESASNSLSAKIYTKIDTGLKEQLKLFIKARLNSVREIQEPFIRLRQSQERLRENLRYLF